MAAADATGIILYQANLRTYQLVRYGVSVQIAAGKPNEQVHLVDWDNPENNDFALAEEVTRLPNQCSIYQNHERTLASHLGTINWL